MTDGGATDNWPEPVSFSDVQRVLSLFTQGLTGCALQIEPLDALPSSGRSGLAVTDGASIYLPAEVADFTLRRHNLGAYRIAVLHQIGYLENGTFAFNLATALTLMPPLLALRLHRGPENSGMAPPAADSDSDLERFFARWHRPALLRRVFITLEDLRIDTMIRRRYPGAQGDLDRVLAHALAGRPLLHTLGPLAALMEGLVRFSLGAERAVLDARDETGRQARLLDAATAVQREAASVYDSAHGALDICIRLEELIHSRPRRGMAEQVANDPSMSGDSTLNVATGGHVESDPDAATLTTSEGLDGFSVEFRGMLMPDLVHRRLHGGQSGMPGQEASSSMLASTPPTTEGMDDRDAFASPTRTSSFLSRHAAPGKAQSFFYDEWDYVHQKYLKTWCRVHEQLLQGDDYGFIGELRDRHARLANQIRQRFASIRPESRQRVHRTSNGDELDLDCMIEAVIDRRAGHATDANLYIRRDRIQRDVCAAFLVDMSASTDFPIPDPNAVPAPAPVPAEPAESNFYLYGGEDVPLPVNAPPKRRVIDVAKEALALMCDALQALGDSHSIYGFSGDGRDNVDFYVAKEFSDAWSARTCAALAAMQPRRSTRTGPSIRHAITKLARQPERTKVLMIVSDGYPEDRDYGPDPRDVEYGIQDTARALQEAERAGILAFCITIDPAGHDYLRRMCAENSYLVIDDVAALPDQLTKVYRTLTAAC